MNAGAMASGVNGSWADKGLLEMRSLGKIEVKMRFGYASRIAE